MDNLENQVDANINTQPTEQGLDAVSALDQKVVQMSQKLDSLIKQQNITKNAFSSKPSITYNTQTPNPEPTFEEKEQSIINSLERKEQEIRFKNATGDPTGSIEYDQENKSFFEEIAFKDICYMEGPEFIKLVQRPLELIEKRQYGQLLVEEVERFQSWEDTYKRMHENRPLDAKLVPNYIRDFKAVLHRSMRSN